MREGERRQAEVLVLAEEEVALGFGLAGCQARAIHSAEELETILDAQLDKPEFGLIIVDSQYFSKLGDRFKSEALESTFPYIFVFPLGLGQADSKALETELREMIRHMTGFNILGQNT